MGSRPEQYVAEFEEASRTSIRHAALLAHESSANQKLLRYHAAAGLIRFHFISCHDTERVQRENLEKMLEQLRSSHSDELKLKESELREVTRELAEEKMQREMKIFGSKKYKTSVG